MGKNRIRAWKEPVVDEIVVKEKSLIDDFYFMQIKRMWQYFKTEHFSFWMICAYLFFEFARPQSIYRSIDILPWAQLFLIGSLAGAFMDKSVKWVPSVISKWLVLYALVIFAASLNAYYPKISQTHYIDFYSWFVVYFLIINIVNTKARFYLFLMVFIICSAKISIGTSATFALRGFAFTDWGLKGPPGYFQNSGELAILMLTFFPLAYLLYDFLKDKVSKREKIILAVFWVTPVITILGASSRGAQVALAVQLMIMFRKSIFRFKPLIAIVLSCFLLYSILPEEQKMRFESAGEDKTSEQRLLYWKHGWTMIKEHPGLGVGYFNFARYYELHHSEDMLYDTAQLPHNIFVQVGTDAGFTGLFVFLMLLLLPFWTSRKLMRNKGKDPYIRFSVLGVLYGLVGFVIAGQFVTVTYYPFLWIGLAFIVSGQNVLAKQK